LFLVFAFVECSLSSSRLSVIYRNAAIELCAAITVMLGDCATGRRGCAKPTVDLK
jgi:hypothetical protein